MTVAELEVALATARRKGIIHADTEVAVKVVPSMETYEADDLSLDVRNGVLTFTCQT